MTLAIFCPRLSRTARTLSRYLRIPLYGRRNHTIPRRGTILINWGSSTYPDWPTNGTYRWINHPESVATAISKVQTYERLREAGIPTLEFTTDRQQVGRWLRNGRHVLARREGLSGGHGIRILRTEDQLRSLGEADFFTKYFPKTHEYRVHVFRGRQMQPSGDYVGRSDHNLRQLPGADAAETEDLHQRGVIDIVQKKRVVEVSDNRTLHQRIIRSHDNGWIFAHNDLYLPDNLRERLTLVATSATVSVGLDFSAVDVAVRILASGGFDIKVLELNTAPGLENTQSIEAYAQAIRGLQ